jgi:hypothetical protein
MAHPVIGNYTTGGWSIRFGDAPPAVGPVARCDGAVPQ